MEQAATILALFITFNPLTCDKNQREKYQIYFFKINNLEEINKK
jgi:hypothetical protein